MQWYQFSVLLIDLNGLSSDISDTVDVIDIHLWELYIVLVCRWRNKDIHTISNWSLSNLCARCTVIRVSHTDCVNRFVMPLDIFVCINHKIAVCSSIIYYFIACTNIVCLSVPNQLSEPISREPSRFWWSFCGRGVADRLMRTLYRQTVDELTNSNAEPDVNISLTSFSIRHWCMHKV